MGIGLYIELPPGYEWQVCLPQWSCFVGGTVLNALGTDSDYRGEIRAILINHGKDIFI